MFLSIRFAYFYRNDDTRKIDIKVRVFIARSKNKKISEFRWKRSYFMAELFLFTLKLPQKKK